ncbi:DUF3822 family protein [Roseivirga sp. BDSF3-8]|uniref:DUF3822 family protein n=1 Tax=Roseivirga sp. BDSF3-8 TaxID=3241598 RepID=UPI003531C657
MAFEKKRYKLVKRIKDDHLSVDRLHEYRLCLQFGERDIQVCIIDMPNSRCLLLEDYISPTSDKGKLQTIPEIFEGHSFLQAGFWHSVRVSIKTPRFVLVPVSLFDKEQKATYLHLNAELDPEKDSLLHYIHQNNETVTVFAANKWLTNFLKEMYATTDLGFIHQGAALTEGTLEDETMAHSRTMYLYSDRFYLNILVSEGKSLVYYNQFLIKRFEDYVKYIMMVLQSMGLDQHDDHVYLRGFIRQDSPHYRELFKYIQNLEFAHKPGFLTFGYQFDELEDHQYYDLYSMSLCR